jgi:hypothetical protein
MMMLEGNRRSRDLTSFAVQQAYFLNKTVNCFLLYCLVLSIFIPLRAGLACFLPLRRSLLLYHRSLQNLISENPAYQSKTHA